jgi:hypothetical protein
MQILGGGGLWGCRNQGSISSECVFSWGPSVRWHGRVGPPEFPGASYGDGVAEVWLVDPVPPGSSAAGYAPAHMGPTTASGVGCRFGVVPLPSWPEVPAPQQ